jgi:hypothetical protein
VSRLPTVAQVIDDVNGILFFKPHIAARGGYSVDALTDCGHNWIHLDAWKDDGHGAYLLGIEHYGVRVSCSKCGRIQAFGPATPVNRSNR